MLAIEEEGEAGLCPGGSGLLLLPSIGEEKPVKSLPVRLLWSRTRCEGDAEGPWSSESANGVRLGAERLEVEAGMDAAAAA